MDKETVICVWSILDNPQFLNIVSILKFLSQVLQKNQAAKDPWKKER
jgi:hypothetical protein